MRKSNTYKHAHTNKSGRQLKIIFLDLLDHSEYSDTDISRIFFFTKKNQISLQFKSLDDSPQIKYAILLSIILFAHKI